MAAVSFEQVQGFEKPTAEEWQTDRPTYKHGQTQICRTDTHIQDKSWNTRQTHRSKTARVSCELQCHV